MSKQRKKRRSQKQGSLTQRAKVFDGIGIVEYEITEEPIHDRAYKKLPTHVRDQIDELYFVVHENPGQAIVPLEDLTQKYPHISQLYNFLSIAYSSIGEDDKAEVIIKKNYEQNPDYLFAKCNYAEICFQKGQVQKIPGIFNNKFDLKLLYPKRKRFHISELVGFAGIMGCYFAKTNEMQTARPYYKMLRKLALKHTMTRRLKRIVYPSVLVQI